MLKPKFAFGDHYQLKKLIDSQGLAEVWEAIVSETDTNEIVALKIFPRLEDDAVEELESKIFEQKSFIHHHLLPAKQIGIINNQPYIEMQFCSNGTVREKVGLLPERELAKCLYQTASAIAFLHKQSMLHGCLKPENILLEGNNYFCYLPDLGLGKIVRQKVIEHMVPSKRNGLYPSTHSEGKNNTAWITPASYHAPELFLENAALSPATDIWALGAIMYELATGKLPFGYLGGKADTNFEDLKDLPKAFSLNLNKLIKRCLSINENDRPTADEIAQATANFFNTGSYKVASLYDTPVTETNTNYPLIFLNETPAPKSTLWKKLSVGLITLSAIGVGVYYLITEPPFSDPGASPIILPDSNLNVTANRKIEAAGIKDAPAPLVKDSLVISKDAAVNPTEKVLAPVIKKVVADTQKISNPVAVPAPEPAPQQVVTKNVNTLKEVKQITPVKKSKPEVKQKETAAPGDLGIPSKRDSEQKPN